MSMEVKLMGPVLLVQRPGNLASQVTNDYHLIFMTTIKPNSELNLIPIYWKYR